MSSSSTLRSRGVVRLVQKRLRARVRRFSIYISNDPKNSPEVVFFDACARARGPFSRGVCVSFYAYFFSHKFATFFIDQIFPLLKIRLSSSSYHGGTPGEHLRDGEGPRELPVLLQGKRGPFLSLSLSHSHALSHPSSLRSFPNDDDKMWCWVMFPHDVRVGPKRHRSARADTASDALDCITNQPSRKRFCSSTCTRYAFATTTRSLRCALFSHLIMPSSLPFSSSF